MLSDEDVQSLFVDAGRKLREGLHVEFLRTKAGSDTDLRDLKLEIAALANDARVIAGLQEDARSETERLLELHRKAFAQLDDDGRTRVDEIRALAEDPVEIGCTLPNAYVVRDDPSRWDSHLYVAKDGTYPAALNNWEAQVVQDEMARSEFVAWYRNLDRKRWSIRIPYQVGTEWRPLYPDFVVFHEDADGDLQVSIVDPHLGKLEDAVPKAVGLARYAERHASFFARIDLVTVEKGVVRRLDLTKADVRSKVAKATSTQHLEALFQDT